MLLESKVSLRETLNWATWLLWETWSLNLRFNTRSLWYWILHALPKVYVEPLQKPWIIWKTIILGGRQHADLFLLHSIHILRSLLFQQLPTPRARMKHRGEGWVRDDRRRANILVQGLCNGCIILLGQQVALSRYLFKDITEDTLLLKHEVLDSVG